jgi:glycosyltransferase involved in cell wall biosynthesis
MALRRHWRRDPPDAVYVATEGPLGWSAVSAARRLQLPVLSGFHTHFDSYSEHYGAGWLQPAVESYLRLFHNRTLATLVPTSDLRRRLASLGLRNLGILGRGVDSSRFDPALRSPELRRSWGAADDSLVLLYVGRLAPEKNLALAVAAYRELRRSRDAVRFVLIGDGPARAALERANPDLTFCGMQTGQALARGYASADIFLFPSETETFGNVTLEAMASGLAVVAYDYAAAHMHIAHGWTGVRVPFGKSRLFIDATVQLGRNPRLVGDLRRRAREYATTVDWASVVKRFETLLLTNDWRRPPREVDLDGISKLAVLARDVPPA